jgi:hypothetical protein
MKYCACNVSYITEVKTLKGKKFGLKGEVLQEKMKTGASGKI